MQGGPLEADYSVALTYIKTGVEVTAGGSYYLRVRAANIHGWGAWSTPIIVIAASSPNAPQPVVTSIENREVRI